MQEIPCKGLVTEISFSGIDGQHLSITNSDGVMRIIRLGPLLCIDFLPLTMKGINNLPEWAKDEIIYRSGDGPSFIQRCMYCGSQESLVCAATVLKDSPDSLLTFDRKKNEGCFDTAIRLRKANVLKLVLTKLVDGTLESRQGGMGTLFTTKMPKDGLKTLKDMILYHPQEFATDILKNMTFIKTPFANPKRCLSSDSHVCIFSNDFISLSLLQFLNSLFSFIM